MVLTGYVVLVAKTSLVAFVWHLATTAKEALQLHPASYEQAFAESASTREWFRRYDAIAAFLSAANVALHSRRFILMYSTLKQPEAVTGALAFGSLQYKFYVLWLVGCWTCTHVVLWLAMPARLFGRHRDAIALLNRAQRLTLLTAAMYPVLFGTPTMMELFFADDMARLSVRLASTPSLLPLALLRLLFVYSGAAHTLVHVATGALPSRLAVLPHVASASLMTFIMAPKAATLVMSNIHSNNAFRALCQAVSGSLDSAVLVAWPWELPCSYEVTQLLLATAGCMVGCVLPILLGSAFEFAAKWSFVGRHELLWAEQQQQQEQRQPLEDDEPRIAKCMAITVGTHRAWLRARWTVWALQLAAMGAVLTTEQLLSQVWGDGLKPLPQGNMGTPAGPAPFCSWLDGQQTCPQS